MLVKADEKSVQLVDNLKGGEGTVIKANYLYGETLPANANMFAELTLNPGCSIGEHTHVGEYEVFFCTQGEIELNDNGVIKTFKAGDFGICYDGEMHSVANKTQAPAVVKACIIRTK